MGITHLVNAADFPAGDVTDLFNAALRTATLDAMQSDRLVRVVGEFDCEYGISWGSIGQPPAFPGLKPYAPQGVKLDLSEAVFVQRDVTAWRPMVVEVDDAGNEIGRTPVVEPRRIHGTTAFHVVGATDFEIIGGQLEGSNLEGAEGVGLHEAWMGFQASRSKRGRVRLQSQKHIWSDFGSIVSSTKIPNEDLDIDLGNCTTNGRHWVNANNARHVAVTGEHHKVQHLIIDHEPGRNGFLEDFLAHDTVGEVGGHGFMQLRPTPSSTIRDIAVRKVTLTRGHFRILAHDCGGKQRDGLTLTDLISDDPHPWPGSHYAGALIRVGGSGAGWNNVTVARVNDLVSAKAGPLDISETSPDPIIEQNVWAA